MSSPLLGRVGEYGWVHVISVGRDLSTSYSSSSIFYKDPDGTVTEKVCNVVDAGAGTFGWTVTTGFFNKVGSWEAMLEVDLGASGIRKLKNPIVFLIGESGEA